MKLAPVANFINFFWYNLHHYQYNALSFDSGYTAKGVNYNVIITSSVMKLTPVANFIKLF
jgi:hypothetical protein